MTRICIPLLTSTVVELTELLNSLLLISDQDPSRGQTALVSNEGCATYDNVSGN